jgi:signal transduction histidine kinase
MKLPLRARITAWYFAVLVVTFAVFARVSDLGFRHSGSREPGVSGLGLAIAHWIVEMHGGSIEVQSTPGSGFLFRISLPVAAAPH